MGPLAEIGILVLSNNRQVCLANTTEERGGTPSTAWKGSSIKPDDLVTGLLAGSALAVTPGAFMSRNYYSEIRLHLIPGIPQI
jgi:hypothetical protein